MRKLFKLLALTLAITSVFVSCESCDTDDVTDPNGGELVGVVTSESGSPLFNVKVSANGAVAYTDESGIFELTGLSPDNYVVQFEKDNYVSNFRKVNVFREKQTVVTASLFEIDVSVSLSSSEDQEVSFNNAVVSIPANGLKDQNGQAYTGDYTMNAKYFSPVADNFFDAFPGDFTGMSATGEEGVLESFGFINVELSAAGQELDLADGTIADIQIPIPQELLNNAPDPIPLFYFDEEAGIWQEEGSASIVDGKYVGSVSHFSNWNADFLYIDESCTIKGRVVDQNGTPLSNALVKAQGLDFSGGNRTYSEDNGRFDMSIKSDASIKVFAQTVSSLSGIVLGQSQIEFANPSCSPGGMRDIGDLIIEVEIDTHGVDTTMADRVWWDVSIGYDEIRDNVLACMVGRNGDIYFADSYNEITETFDWVAQNSNLTQTLLGVDFIDGNTIWACGNNGAILKTENAGQNWQQIQLNTSGNDLYEIEFVGSNFGCMVGTVGNIWYTNDGGNRWDKTNTNIIQDLYSVDFIDDKIGWAVGTVGKIFKTTDGGVNWAEQNSNTTSTLHDVSFLNDLFGWAVGEDGTLLMTENGGSSWTSMNGLSGHDILSVQFVTRTSGYATSATGRLFTTRDGGVTWTNEKIANRKLWDIEIMTGAFYGIVVGEDYSKTFTPQYPEGSNGWNVVYDNSNMSFNAIEYIDDNRVVAAGNSGRIMFSNDGGSTWSAASVPVSVDLYDLAISNNGIYAAGDNETILRSSNGSQWTTIHQVSNNRKIVAIQANNNSIWILTQDEGGYNSEFKYSFNGGSSFANASGLPSGNFEWFNDFHIKSNGTGFIVGTDETVDYEAIIFESFDNGRNWSKVNLGSLQEGEFTTIEFYNDELAWVSGDLFSNTMMVTEDGGNTWQMQYTFIVFGIIDFEIVDKNYGWALMGLGSGIENSIRVSTNRGIDWYRQSEDGAVSCLDMRNRLNGVYATEDGKIYRSTTGGF